ncbi:MAG: hypothetical protein LBJ31_04650 [Treponema sp.]|nr:hypothetical protein [Treponema sp.]
MDKLNQYNMHDAKILSFTIEKLRNYFSINIEVVLFDGENINIRFNDIENYRIDVGNIGQYILEIDVYKCCTKGNNKIYEFKLHGDDGVINIESKNIAVKKIRKGIKKYLFKK